MCNLYFQEFSDKIPSHFELNANLYTVNRDT